MVAPYNFGMSQEDERSEAAALALDDSDRVLCIASAGEMPLSLLALGAREVVAVDADVSQLHLAELKLQALLVLPHEQALRLLGYLPARPGDRKRWWHYLSPHLGAAACAFWQAHLPALVHGAVWAGRYERYVRLLVRLVRPVLGRRPIDKLFEATTLEEQREIFDRHLGRPAIRALFRIAFHPAVYRSRGMDPRSLQHRRSGSSLGEQFFGQFRALCTANLAADNPLLQLTLLGRLLSADCAPAGLSRQGAEVLRSRRQQLRFIHGDMGELLAEQPVGRFDKIQLSNLPDWLSQDQFDELLRTVAARIARPGRAVWRYLHMARQLPSDLLGPVELLPALGAELGQQDRFPFYRIVPAAFGPRD